MDLYVYSVYLFISIYIHLYPFIVYLFIDLFNYLSLFLLKANLVKLILKPASYIRSKFMVFEALTIS